MNVTRAGSEATRLSSELALQVQALVRVVEDEPAIPASEVCAVLHHPAAFEFGLAQALHHLTVCVDRSAEPDLFWAATNSAKTRAWATAAITSAAQRLRDGERQAVQLATALTDTREDLFPEAMALQARLMERDITVSDSADRATPHPAELDPAWMTADDTADELGIPLHTLTTIWASRRLTPTRHRIEEHIAYRRSEVIAVRDARQAQQATRAAVA